VGGFEITGVLLELMSLLLHAVNNIRPQRHTVVKNLFLAVILDRRTFILSLWDPLTRHAILTLNPTAKINKLTALRTEGTDGIVFPLDWFTAGRTLHGS